MRACPRSSGEHWGFKANWESKKKFRGILFEMFEYGRPEMRARFPDGF